MAPTAPIANSGLIRTHATVVPGLRKRRSLRQEEIVVNDAAAAVDLVRRASINYRDASSANLNKAAQLVRVWLSSDAWARDRIYRQRPMSLTGVDTTVNPHLKRKSGKRDEDFYILERSVRKADAECERDSFPVTTVEKVAGDDIRTSAPAKRSRWRASNPPRRMTRKQLRCFESAQPSSMSMDDPVSLFDPDKNSLLQISFADYKKGFLGFRMVNSHRGQRGLNSKQFIVPVIASIFEKSGAYKGGLRRDMRILSVGRVSIQPGERMPRGDDDYSPMQRTKDLIVEAIERDPSALVLIRVDSLTV
jgi:hypothetical protein